MDSGGFDSYLWKSIDSGNIWIKFIDCLGLFKGIIGIIGVIVLLFNFDCVWVIIEVQEGGVFCLDDAGKIWIRISVNCNLCQCVWYYS